MTELRCACDVFTKHDPAGKLRVILTKRVDDGCLQEKRSDPVCQKIEKLILQAVRHQKLADLDNLREREMHRLEQISVPTTNISSQEKRAFRSSLAQVRWLASVSILCEQDCAETQR